MPGRALRRLSSLPAEMAVPVIKGTQVRSIRSFLKRTIGPRLWDRLRRGKARVRRLGRHALHYGGRPRPASQTGSATSRALLCYLPARAVRNSALSSHPNATTCAMLAHLLAGRGYRVDFVAHDSMFPIDYSRYSVIVGFGEAYEQSFYVPFAGKRIYFQTGSCPSFSNPAEAMRIRDVQQRTGIYISPRRQVTHGWALSAVLSELVVVTGTAWTVSTWSPLNPRTVGLPASTVHQSAPPLVAPLDLSRTKFLFLSGSGMVHKGLDLVLDALALPALDEEDLVLDVLAPARDEPDFYKAYAEKISNDRRITFYGYQPFSSAIMQRLLSESTFVLGTSCAEGCCSAVVTAMRHGAIPIAAPQSGIDIGSFGIALAELTPSAVAAAMRVAITMSPEDVMRRREAAWRVTNAESSRAHLDGLLESYFDMVL